MNIKRAVIRYYRNRLETYQLTPKNKEKEKEIIEQILANNKYDPHLLTIEPKKKKHDHITQPQKQRWAKFMYVGKETRFITKLFKHTNVKVTFSTNNTISRHLTCEQKTPQPIYDKCGVFQLTCPDCKMTYTGQTGRPFKTRYKEHMRDFSVRGVRAVPPLCIIHPGICLRTEGKSR